MLTDTLTARQDSDITRAFGIPALREETSENFSLGFVATPTDRFRLTVDLYRVNIDDRIVLSSYLAPEDPATCGVPFNPALCPVGAILNPQDIGQVQFFTNAADTETEGLDIVALWDFPVGDESLVGIEAAANFNKTDVVALRSSSSIVSPSALFDATQITLIEEGQPQEHYVVGVSYHFRDWKANVRANYFGSVAGEGFTPGFKQTWDGEWLVDATIGYAVNENLSLSVGGVNVFDQYPDEWDTVNAFPFPQLGFIYGWETLPFGINGGYYFLHLNYRVNH